MTAKIVRESALVSCQDEDERGLGLVVSPCAVGTHLDAASPVYSPLLLSILVSV